VELRRIHRVGIIRSNRLGETLIASLEKGFSIPETAAREGPAVKFQPISRMKRWLVVRQQPRR